MSKSMEKTQVSRQLHRYQLVPENEDDQAVPAGANWIWCYEEGVCPYQSACLGDYYQRTGECAITCFFDVGEGEIEEGGYADCSCQIPPC